MILRNGFAPLLGHARLIARLWD